MSLANLLRIGQLKAHPPDGAEIRRLLDAAARNLADSQVKAVSPETRFDAAYKAIMQASLAAMMANGYRPDTHRPGHHQTLVQSLGLTAGIPASRITVIDTLRRKRNLSDYTGEDIDDSSVGHCVEQASRLVDDVKAWIGSNEPTLFRPPE